MPSASIHSKVMRSRKGSYFTSEEWDSMMKSALPQTNTFNFFMLLWILGGYRLAVFLTMRIYSKLFGKSRAMDDPSKWVHQQLRRRVFPVIIILFLACSIPLANTGLGKNVFQHLKVGVNTRGDALERAWGRYQIGRQGTDEFIYLSQTYGAIQLEQARREYNRFGDDGPWSVLEREGWLISINHSLGLYVTHVVFMILASVRAPGNSGWRMRRWFLIPLFMSQLLLNIRPVVEEGTSQDQSFYPLESSLMTVLQLCQLKSDLLPFQQAVLFQRLFTALDVSISQLYWMFV